MADRREYNRQWHLRNRERVLERMRRYREADRARMYAMTKSYVQRNPEKIAATMRSYRDDPEHRAVSRGKPCTLTRDEIEGLYAQAGMACPLCYVTMLPRGSGRGHALRPDTVSIDRLDNNRGYEPGNVWVICGDCNRKKGNLVLPWLRRLVAALEKQSTTPAGVS